MNDYFEPHPAGIPAFRKSLGSHDRYGFGAHITFYPGPCQVQRSVVEKDPVFA